MEALLYLFSGFRWQDGLDILLNTYILFRLYVLFRGTNVIQALLTICVLWAVSQAAVSPKADHHKLGNAGYYYRCSTDYYHCFQK